MQTMEAEGTREQRITERPRNALPVGRERKRDDEARDVEVKMALEIRRKNHVKMSREWGRRANERSRHGRV